LKKSNPITSGQVNLSMQEGSLFKRSLICRTGCFNGLYGPIQVTAEMLSRIAEKYNRERATPANQSDFAPIIKDHERRVDNVVGRILADLSVQDWSNPETGVTEQGLFATLRIDDELAKSKVVSGLYSQLSISFDEEASDLFECSFVAVEAARRSQVLSKGEPKMNVELKLQKLSKKHKAVLSKLSSNADVKLALGQSIAAGESDIALTQKAVAAVMTSVRTAALSSQFKGFVKQGKMTKAEFDKLEVAALASLPKTAVTAVLASYDNRAVSSDIAQIGQTGAKPVKPAELTGDKMRAAIAAQRAGKAVSLSEVPGAEQAPKDDKAKEDAAKQAATGEGDDGESDMSFSDMDETMKHLESIGPMIEKLGSYMTKMKESLAKLQESKESDSEDGEESDESKEKDSKEKGDK
jgi:hypothetical protein